GGARARGAAVPPLGRAAPRERGASDGRGGAPPPREGDPQALSSGTPVRIDPKTGVANRGSVSVLAPEPGKWRQIKTIPVGLHPCGMALSRTARFLYVANASSDTVSVIDTENDEVVETIPCRPEARLPFASPS